MNRKVTTFTVRGRGNFPFDMLRYDAAWPTDPYSADHLGRIFTHPDTNEVNLATVSIMGPTRDRWLSFGWSVSNVQKVG